MRDFAVVIIGRNEGDRLRRCLESVAGRDIVYVDSGSTDDSIATAERAGAEITRLDPATGFTAARARNTGFEALRARGRHDFIQFVDGDCEIVSGWLESACERLVSDPNLAVVAGRRRERFPAASIFNKLCDMEWNTPVGPARAVGGDAMYRAAAFEAVGGFDPTLICGEEPELCLRLLRQGWRIERLDLDMTLHDAAMTRWSQWFRRTMRAGWAFEEGYARHGAGPERYCHRERRRLWLWGAMIPAVILLCGLATLALGAADSPLWPATALAAVGAAALYPAMTLRIALRRRRAYNDEWPHALLYGSMVMLGKIPEACGALRFRLRADGPARLIEYKG